MQSVYRTLAIEPTSKPLHMVSPYKPLILAYDEGGLVAFGAYLLA